MSTAAPHAATATAAPRRVQAHGLSFDPTQSKNPFYKNVNSSQSIQAGTFFRDVITAVTSLPRKDTVVDSDPVRAIADVT